MCIVDENVFIGAFSRGLASGRGTGKVLISAKKIYVYEYSIPIINKYS